MPTINQALKGFEAIRHLVLNDTGVLGPRRFDDERFNHPDPQRVLINYADAVYGYVDQDGKRPDAPRVTIYAKSGGTVVDASTLNQVVSIRVGTSLYIMHFSHIRTPADKASNDRLVLGEAIMRYTNAEAGERHVMSGARRQMAVDVLYEMRDASIPSSVTREWVDWVLDLIYEK